MKRKIVQTGSSLAVTLPAEVVEAFGLKKGQEVDVAVHPTTGAVVIRPGVKYFEDGKVTKPGGPIMVSTNQPEPLYAPPVTWPRARSVPPATSRPTVSLVP